MDATQAEKNGSSLQVGFPKSFEIEQYVLDPGTVGVGFKEQATRYFNLYMVLWQHVLWSELSNLFT